MPDTFEAERDKLTAYIRERAQGAPDEPLKEACWVSGSAELPTESCCDETNDFCPICAGYEIRRLKKKFRKFMRSRGVELSIGRSYGSGEEDSVPHCELCGIRLSCNLTEDGIDQELDAISEEGYLSEDPRGWAELLFVLENLEYEDEPRWRRVERIVKRARSLPRYARTLEILATTHPIRVKRRKSRSS